jgi:hypothetical protein
MRQDWRRLIGVIGLMLLLGACSGAPAASVPGGSEAATLAPGLATQVTVPEAGKATVTGQIISSRTSQPLAQRVVRLGEVINEDLGDGDRPFVFNEATSPSARTDAEGRFVIANITPGEYVMVIANDLGDNLIITTSAGTAEVWKADGGQVLNVGSLRVDFP